MHGRGAVDAHGVTDAQAREGLAAHPDDQRHPRVHHEELSFGGHDRALRLEAAYAVGEEGRLGAGLEPLDGVRQRVDDHAPRAGARQVRAGALEELEHDVACPALDERVAFGAREQLDLGRIA